MRAEVPPGGGDYVTDFVIVSFASEFRDVILIELEPPTEAPFTKAGAFARRLNEALKQVDDWFVWIDQNRDLFGRSLLEAIRVSDPGSLSGGYRPKFDQKVALLSAKIVIGRRSMMSEEDNARRVAMYARNRAIEVLPYDRLLDIGASQQDA